MSDFDMDKTEAREKGYTNSRVFLDLDHLKKKNPSVTEQVVVLVLFVALCCGGGAVCGLITAKEFGDDSPWYRNLIKPSWNPPSWLFGPVWGILYFLMALAAWFVWRVTGFCKQPLPLIFFFIQLIFNFMWVFIFGLAHQLLGAFVEIIILWCLIVMTMVLFFRVTKWVPLLLLPYLGWVTFASCLNYSLYKLNPDNGEGFPVPANATDI